MAKPTQPLLPSSYTLQTARAELAELLDVYADSDEQERSLFDLLIPELRDFIEAEEEKICHQTNTQEELEAEIYYATWNEGGTRRIHHLQWELSYRKALDASPLKLGDAVIVGPAWRMGAAHGDGGSYHHSGPTGETGTVLAFTGEEIMIAEHTDRAYPAILEACLFDVATVQKCPCGAWSDKHRANPHAAGCSHRYR